MGAVHLRMVKLKGDGHAAAEELFPVPAPDEERIVVYAAVHAHRPVDLRVQDGRCADDHAVLRQVPVDAGLRRPGGIGQVFPAEGSKIVRKMQIAGADLSGFVFHDSTQRGQ